MIFLPNYHWVLISWTSLDLIKFVFMRWCFALGSLLCVCSFIDVSLFLLWKRTRHWCSIIPCFKTKPTFVSWLKQWEIQDSLWFSDFLQHFRRSSYCGGTDCEIDSLRTIFIPRIFEEKDWVDLFGNFEDPIDELVKEFYSNARFIRVKLKCWVWGKEFIITPD